MLKSSHIAWMEGVQPQCQIDACAQRLVRTFTNETHFELNHETAARKPKPKQQLNSKQNVFKKEIKKDKETKTDARTTTRSSASFWWRAASTASRATTAA